MAKTLALRLLGLTFARCASTTTARLHLPELRTVPKVELEAILQRLAAQGYETNRLVRTEQGSVPHAEPH